MTKSSVVASGVSFMSGVEVMEDSSNRAVQSDSNSVFTAQECVFDGWLGDTVIYHRSSGADSLSLDSCDFSGSSAIIAAFSLNSDAKIRNAVVGDRTFASDGRLNNSLPLVNRALDCGEPDICGPGECVDSTLGVVCECLDVENCLNDGGGLTLVVGTPPANETYSPDAVSFELVVSAAGNGTTYASWDLAFEAKDLNLDVAPSSGVLPPGGSITVVVTGMAVSQGVSETLTSRFNLTTVCSASTTSNAGVTLEVNSTFYLCPAYKYADTLAAEDNDLPCKPCISIDGGEGVDCTSPGATLTSLPLRQGYWRSGRESLVVHKCGYLAACAGATEVSSADDYCANGYQGPYCAICSEGYGRGVNNACHSCDNTEGQRFIWAGVTAAVVVLLLVVVLAVVFLVGGLDAVHTVRKTVRRSASVANKTSKVWAVPKKSPRARAYPQRRIMMDDANDTIAPVLDFGQHLVGKRDTGHSSGESPPTSSGPEDAGSVYVPPSSAVVGVGTSVGLPDVPAGPTGDVGTPAGRRARPSTVAGAAGGGAQTNEGEGLRTSNEGKTICCCLGVDIKRWVSKLPLNEFKILVVVWQILTVFTSITGVEFPESYSKFLTWINVVNFDIGHLFSAVCILPSVNFYGSLLATTLTPLVLVAVLLLTYQMAMRRAGIGSVGVVARRAAWSRHVSAGLLLTFLIFTSASTLVFKTFSCDDAAVDGKSYLRADYSILCESGWHTFFKCYAGIMILVYPIGIPALYAVILWGKRGLLNPRIHTAVMPEINGTDGTATRANSAGRAGFISAFRRTTSKAQTKTELPLQELQEFKERVRARREHPELTPSMFLWKDFGPDLFYYEVIECGRRILLTGVLIFIPPNSSTQVAVACVFAFGSMLGFELLRPHVDPADAWLYRLGCVVIFFSYFLALLINVDAAGEDGRSALADILVAINMVLVLAVFLAPWVAARRRAAIGG